MKHDAASTLTTNQVLFHHHDVTTKIWPINHNSMMKHHALSDDISIRVHYYKDLATCIAAMNGHFSSSV